MRETLRDPEKTPYALWAYMGTGELHPVQIVEHQQGIGGYLVRSLRDGRQWWADQVHNDWELPTR